MKSHWPCFPTQGQQERVLAQEPSKHDTVFITASPPPPGLLFSTLRLWEPEMGGAGWASPEGRSLNTEGGWALSHNSGLTAPPHLGACHFLHYHAQQWASAFHIGGTEANREGQCTESEIQNCTSGLLGSRPPSLDGQDKSEEPGLGLQGLTRRQAPPHLRAMRTRMEQGGPVWAHV